MLPVLSQRAFSCTVSECECVDTLRFASSGTFVQSASMCICVRTVDRDVRQLCVLGCMSTGINKWSRVMAETCLRADSTGERQREERREKEGQSRGWRRKMGVRRWKKKEEQSRKRDSDGDRVCTRRRKNRGMHRNDWDKGRKWKVRGN